MEPGLRVDLSERRNGVPGYVPDDLLPAADLDVGFHYEFGVSCLKERSEAFQSGALEHWRKGRVGEEADLCVFRFYVCHNAGRGLSCSYPCL